MALGNGGVMAKETVVYPDTWIAIDTWEQLKKSNEE